MNRRMKYDEDEVLVLSRMILWGMGLEVIFPLGMAVGMGIFGTLGMLSALALFILSVAYGIILINLRNLHRSLLVAGIAFVLRMILLLIMWLMGIKAMGIVVAGIFLILSDFFLGIGMKNIVQDESSGLKWSWAIWKYVGVIVGIIAIYVSYDSGTKLLTTRFFSDIFKYPKDLKLVLCTFATYWVFRLIQGTLMHCTAKVM